MAIETVFVVGAGAGVPYGMPTGLKLRQFIAFGPYDMPERYEVGKPAKAGLKDQLALAVRCTPESVSIDSLLNSRSDDLGEIGKFNIAHFIADAERNAIHVTLKSPPAEAERTEGRAAKLPLSEDWLGWMNSKIIGLMRSGSFANVAFVTFNYDRLIEISAAIALREMFPRDWRDRLSRFPRVFHVYGKLAGDPLLAIDSGQIDRGWSKTDYVNMMSGIRLMEDRSNGEHAELTEAKAALQDATRIVFLGFGYDQLNIEIIGIRGIADRRKRRWPRMCGTACGMSEIEIGRTLNLLGEDSPHSATSGPVLFDRPCLKLLRTVWSHDWFVPQA